MFFSVLSEMLGFPSTWDCLSFLATTHYVMPVVMEGTGEQFLFQNKGLFRFFYVHGNWLSRCLYIV